MELLLIFALGTLALVLAATLARSVLPPPEGEPEMVRVAGLLRTAAEGFVRQRAGAIRTHLGFITGVIAVLAAAALITMYFLR